MTGDVSENSHACRIRVRYAECDPMNVAHHASYVAWLEEARTEMLRDAGVRYADLEAAGVLLMVASMEIRYRRPIRYDEVVEVRTRVASFGRATVTHAYALTALGSADPAPAAEATVTLACCDRDGRPRRLPESLRSAIGVGPGAGPAGGSGPKRTL